MQRVFQELSSHFPKIIDELDYIMVDDITIESGFGDPVNYPLNGDLQVRGWHSFELLPRGMGLFPHRIQATTNFEGTLTHELTHLIDKEFTDEWSEKFKWAQCANYPDDWESRTTSDMTERKFFNKHTGEMSPQGEFSLQPDQCVTVYARQNMNEDICDSMVAYIYDPEFLKSVSPDKFDILQRHDVKKPKPEVAVQRIAAESIRLPETKPETIYYYIKEPTT